MGKRVLIAGESWMTTSTHVKGVDEFSVHSYVEGVGPLRDALTSRGHDVTHMPAHLVPTQFPGNAEALSQFDVVVLSDIGANSLQLAPGVFDQFRAGEDRLVALRDWVGAGGSLMMIGGYLSFSGFQARAAFRQTAIAEEPVREAKDGVRMTVVQDAQRRLVAGQDTGHQCGVGALVHAPLHRALRLPRAGGFARHHVHGTGRAQAPTLTPMTVPTP